MPEPTPSPTAQVMDAAVEAAQFHADVLARMDVALGALVFIVLVAAVVVVKALW